MEAVDDEDDPARGQARRQWLADVNDGLIASAGMVEGVAQAGATAGVILVSGVATVLVGVATVAGIRFAEASDERDAHDALVEAERHRVATDPAAELAELAEIYEEKGLSPQLARQVAEELTAHDALAAQLDAEYRLAGPADVARPGASAARAGAAFATGAVLPLLVSTLVPPSVRVSLTVVVVVAALVVSATLAARSGRTSAVRAVVRTVGIGVLAMLITIGLGSLLDLSEAEVEL
ncbi:VIT1/CCC1 transporter family protein [Cellulomonas chitinilytica]|uniref:VIT1/CCC1 transporter family protein n=1 Tax=Cellulomonas chitinilytica TaxID=398759 RepID=UPI00194231A7|nr:VIT1/CCC1 transporter family protein [Cellulomonas chitinilytica]